MCGIVPFTQYMLIRLHMTSLLTKVLRKQLIADVVKDAADAHALGTGLKKVLGVRDLISFGISSTLGSGIFVTVGSISGLAGPGLFLSFLVAAFGSLLSAFCYAEFASRLPVSGQSYTYSYVSLGELVAFTTGWLAFISYSVATAAVSRGWANYVDSFVRAVVGTGLPAWLVNEPVDGWYGMISLSGLAALLNLFCMTLACFGVHESTRISFILVIVNLVLMTCFSAYGAFNYGEAANLEPLLPFGLTGVVKGSGLAFFCCIGWELVCTLSEEVKKPSRDLPRGIMGSLGAVSVLYCAVCLTLSAMVPFTNISVSAPIADAFRFHGDNLGALVVSLTVVVVCIPSTITGVVGTPRMLYKMAMDGLIYDWLAIVNSHGSPVYATLVCGTFSAILGGVLHFESLASSCSAVTLFMFAIVCVGVVIVRANECVAAGYVNSISHLTFSLVAFCVISFAFCLALVNMDDFSAPVLYSMGFANLVAAALTVRMYDQIASGRRTSLDSVKSGSNEPLLNSVVVVTGLNKKGRRNIYLCPLVPYMPLLATWVDLFMMASLGYAALGGLLLMLVSGLAVYFSYGIKNSKLGKR